MNATTISTSTVSNGIDPTGAIVDRAAAPIRRIARIARIARIGTVLLALLVLIGATAGRAGAASTDLLDLVTMATEDVETTWSDIFAAAGIDYAGVEVYLVDRTTRTDCFTFRSTDTFGFCSPEATVYLGSLALDELEAEYGRFAVAVTVAEAYSYHLLTLLGVDSEGIDREVQAACLAGFWAVEMELIGRVDAGAAAELESFYQQYWTENGDVLAQGYVIGTEAEFADDCLDLFVDDGSGSGGYGGYSEPGSSESETY